MAFLPLLFNLPRHVLSRIWRNLHRDIEIDRIRRSEEKELLKLGGGQNIFIFKGGLPYEGRGRGKGGGSEKIHFQGILRCEKGANFLGGGSYPSAYYEVTFGQGRK